MEVSREEMLEFGKMATFRLDDRLVPFDRVTLRAEAWLMGHEMSKRFPLENANQQEMEMRIEALQCELKTVRDELAKRDELIKVLQQQPETLLRALRNSGLDYVDGKIIGRHVPKFCVGDIVRHKNYGEQTCGNCHITYVSENGYSYIYADGSGGGTFSFSGEEDYNLIKED